VATFEYRCDAHGVIGVRLPIGTAKPSWPCPVCDQDAIRVFTAPMLSFAPAERVAIIDRAERSRYEPEVVSTIPATGARRRTPMAPANPALQRLPRP
jgi:ABC-type ATPase with predicted acetyltransferase domain